MKEQTLQEAAKQIIKELLEGVKELNGEYQDGWDGTIDKAEKFLNELSQLSDASKEEPKVLEELQEIIESCIGHSDLNVVPSGFDLNQETTDCAKDILKNLLPYLRGVSNPIQNNSEAVQFAKWIFEDRGRDGTFEELYTEFLKSKGITTNTK